MSKFRERFKDKISIVGRDGVQVHVSTGKVSGAAHEQPKQVPEPRGRGGRGAGRPVGRGAGYAGVRSEGSDATGGSPRDEVVATKPPSFVPMHPPQPSHIPPPVVSGGMSASPVATVHRGEPPPQSPPASQQPPQPQHQQPPAAAQTLPQSAPLPQQLPAGFTQAQPLQPSVASPAHLLAQQQHLLQLQSHQQQLMLMQQRIQQQPVASPALMSDAEWLKQATEASQMQLFQLQSQLGLQQQLPPPSQTPDSLVSDNSGAPIPVAGVVYPNPSAAAVATQPQSAPTQGQAAPAKEVGFGRRKGSSKALEGRKASDANPARPTALAPQPSSAPSGATPKIVSGGTPKAGEAKYGRRAMEGVPSYKPYTISDYKQINQPVKLGGLGPEDNEEKQALRQQKMAAREYANKIRSANEEKTSAVVQNRGRLPITKQPTAQQKAAAERRAKALEFASKVPKPKAVADEGSSASSPQRMPTAAEVEIMNLEAQHHKDQGGSPLVHNDPTQEAIREIKKNLGLL